MSIIRIGTRGSKLALWQAQWVASQLSDLGIEVHVEIISTQGDISTQPLSQVGGQGLFTKEIQRELLAKRVDVAVHSLKDLPTQPIPGLHLAAVPLRETTADVLVSASGLGLEALPAGSRIGTGSSRRAAQLRHWRRDIEVIDIRGNVDTRLAKLAAGDYDAIVLAAAGLTRLGLQDRITEVLPASRILPAVGQGALGLECREDDHAALAALAKLDHVPSHAEVLAERSLLLALLAGCLAPVAARGTVKDGQLHLVGRVLSLDGQQVISGSQRGPIEQATLLGSELAHDLLALGAAELIAAARQ
ncbi:MAG: hydroxymethylbilane synthase [Pirellulaceae bacterium]|nr:hydroxymethylbilane synthase [Pirellulaceae bacterium]